MYWRWRLNQAGVSFTSSPLDTGQGTGTDTCRAAHLCGGSAGTTKLLVSAFPPHMSHALPVCEVGDVDLLTCLILSLWLYFHECFKPAHATDMAVAWVSHCSWLLVPPLSSCAITPKCISECSWTTTNQGLQKGYFFFFFNPVDPHSSSLSDFGETFMALWPGARDDLGGEGPAAPRASLPARVGGRRKQQAELINQKLWHWWKYIVHMHRYAHRNVLYYSQFHTRQVFSLIEYESRTISVVFSMLHMLCWYAWRMCAQYRHRLRIKSGKESYLVRQSHFSSFQLHSKDRQLFGSILCA